MGLLVPDTRRALHWVFKVGNLKKAVQFYEEVWKMQVLRHEEFESGCEATCNGPYGGAWSKTMMGYGPEKDSFAIELTYNYGVDSYPLGNDLQYIALIGDEGVIERAQKLGYNVEESSKYGGLMIQGPDDYKFKIVPSTEQVEEAFVAVALRVNDLGRAVDYYTNVLSMSIFENIRGLSQIKEMNTLVGYANEQVKLQLIKVSDGKPVDHALSSGRIAFATHTGVASIFEKVTQNGDAVMTPPLTLPTPGKADVVVTILADRDGYEICFVEDVGFYELCLPTYDVICWEKRAKKGADGNALPKLAPLQYSGNIKHIMGPKEYEDALKIAGKNLIVVDFMAPWCSKCKKLLPVIEKLAQSYSDVAFLSVDIDEDQDFAMDLNVSKVPTFFFIKEGKKIDEYVGSEASVLGGKLSSLTI